MPIYEYKCENGHVFDVMQRMYDDPLTGCVECDAPVRKILHPVGISFKGSGFYSTDYSKKDDPKPESKETVKGGDASNGSSDSKGEGAKKPGKAPKAETSQKQD